MNPSTARASSHPPKTRNHPHGFALIVTLSLMILLTVIAVGLLSLSSISLRSSAQGEAMQAARANARLALMLAIGDLQKQLGPDTRVSATADQIATAAAPAVSTTPQTQRQWAGAYKAWTTGLPADARPAPEFLQWFVSGDPANLIRKDFAGTAISTNPKTFVEIVTANTVGSTGDTVRVPMITQTNSNKTQNKFAWWVSDLGTKAIIAPAKEIPTSIAEVRADQQVAPASNLKSASSGASKPFNALALADPRLPKVASWQSAGLIADTPQNIRGLFHDLTPQSRGLLTNVRSGGFRKDLSMELERTAANAPQPTGTNVLYTVGDGTGNKQPGINLHELWAYYNLSNPDDSMTMKRTGTATFTTGGTMPSGTPYLQVANDAAACRDDGSFYFKQPVIISYQIAFSFEARNVIVGAATVKRLHLVADPILTFWNPLDVPVVIPTTAFMSVKYWQIPYDLFIGVKGSPLNKFPIISSLSAAITDTAGRVRNGDGNFLSLQVGQSQQLVFKPGEVIKVSQIGNSIVKGTSPVDHALVAKAGFNYGGGVSVPVRDIAGKYVDLKATDVINYQAKPNNLTAGSTTSDGNSLNGQPNHSRHFSLTHNEYYIGADRGGNSLGIGNMAIDWDFGNRRLKAGENRGTMIPGISGTKPSDARMTADKFTDIFKSITTESRDLPVSAMSTKQPFMIMSFNAKTETGSKTGTRFLSRFNPKALHVDFYDLSEKERDMLPYEFSIEALSSWKNRNLETSINGNAYYGGGLNAADGASFVTTHSIPREPIVSLAAFQHSFANGFDIQKPKYGYGSLNAREPMLPQIAHAIGNSTASPMLASDKTEGTLAGGRPLADHSYLANQALWDDWFLSGITPQSVATFSKSRSQKIVATEFFNNTTKLPVSNYICDLHGNDPAKIISTYFSGTTPSAAATDFIASLIRVDGMFNVNSTSVEAWKCLLGGRKERPVVVRDTTGKESIKTGSSDTPVAGLLSPQDLIAPGSGNVDPQQAEQWVGRRTLSDIEIDTLARGIVKEVRKRGPFLSLADFINRRVGTDTDLARAGAIQNALDSTDVQINTPYQSGTRAVSTATSGRFAFKEAEQGPLALGSPGIVKQADILTPIAPILSARSDSFLIRGYGEKTDAAGNVIARAWCEAVVQRSPEFVDPTTDAPEKLYSSISTLNKTFGRRFDIVSFRWLSSTEA